VRPARRTAPIKDLRPMGQMSTTMMLIGWLSAVATSIGMPYEKGDRLTVESAERVRHPKRNRGRDSGDGENIVEYALIFERVSARPTRTPSSRSP